MLKMEEESHHLKDLRKSPTDYLSSSGQALSSVQACTEEREAGKVAGFSMK